MSYASFLVLVAFGAVVASATNICVPNSRFRLECNECACSSDGRTYACTKMICPVVKRNADTKVCIPSTHFKEDCNYCFCGPDGMTKSCTKMYCPKLAKLAKASPEEKQKICEPNTNFMKYCNHCRCSPDGLIAACTRMACPRDIFNLDGTLKPQPTNLLQAPEKDEKVCEPGSRFKESCNHCTCSDDGKMKFCTRMSCEFLENRVKKSSDDDLSQICEPNSTFKDYCNHCRCSANGKAKACTRMLCPEGAFHKNGTRIPQVQMAAQTQEQVCKPGEKFKEGCNSCKCSKDGLMKMCTMMKCPEDLQIKEPQCEPGKVFKSKCNTCICSDNGQSSVCTLKICLNRSASDESSEVENDETEVWGPSYKEGDKCVAGSLFYNECNMCICSQDGLSAACTKKMCIKH